MKVSISWLSEYIPVKMAVGELADALTMAGLEVDAVWDRYEFLRSVLVGRIIDVFPHPGADRLKLCDVNIGDRMIRVVCGAPNAQKAMTVAAALPGTELPDGTLLEKCSIRGENSEGMLCSEKELGLGADGSGIMALDASFLPGTPVAKALELSDWVLDIDLTPNRSDCLCILGIAREVAAIQGGRVQYPDMHFPNTSGNRINSLTSVRIESPEHCPRYAARLVENIAVMPSPFWLQDRLVSVGLRPINNIVDITNFVMMETGQPLHAFDFDELAGQRIIVRCAEEGESFTTLDKKERRLSGNTLMICDGEKPVAIAGVMGGFNSEIRDNTKRVLIESACFSPMSIRKTSKKLGLFTDASHRFERGVDPEKTVWALNRAARLMVDIAHGVLVDGIIDEHPGKSPEKNLSLSVEDTNRTLGTDLDGNKIRSLLESIEFTVSLESDDRLKVTPPSCRMDIARPIDLMEEAARLYGYNHIPTTFPTIMPQANIPSRTYDLRKKIKEIMIGLDFSEAIHYSFMDHRSLDRLNLPDTDFRSRTLRILNPLTEDQTVMRTLLLPGLLQTMHRNLSRQMGNFKLFEIGKTFISNGQNCLPDEIETLAGLWTGARHGLTWHEPSTSCDFFDLKGSVEGLLRAIHVDSIAFTRVSPEKCIYTRPGYSATICAGHVDLGLIGELHPEVIKKHDLRQTAYVFEINLDALLQLVPDSTQALPLPKYPSVMRDVTLIIDNCIESFKILDSFTKLDENLIESVHLFDVFEGELLPRGKKSISFRIIYRSADRTLSDDEVNRLHKDITARIIQQFDAVLPI
jgi:phenylalanyl-tRNA synthetase beta chain